MTQPKHTHQTWDDYLREGTGPVQDKFLELVRGTRDSRHYCNNVIWGNLQTEDYARAVFRRVVDFHEIPDDVEAGVARRAARAQFIGQGGRTYHVLLSEQALRTNLGGAEVMRGQLTHLLDTLELPGLKLGVIPARAQLALYPGHSFTIFDGRHVHVETFSAGLDVKDEREVATYEKAFALLERSAVYGQEARELVEAELAVLT
ncbi:DUF5753 domain-containing protein [Streptomyces sp. NPDC020951]|uniref:DUF5753 domain-containing protein n=1 Tax=Streptomyces sp. NPDC020951 TaxID=3365104 RepID=UPI00378C6379